jgi:hypothetical protein
LLAPRCFSAQFEHKPWAPRLLAISCLSVAAKMQRAAAISVADIQVRRFASFFC